MNWNEMKRLASAVANRLGAWGLAALVCVIFGWAAAASVPASVSGALRLNHATSDAAPRWSAELYPSQAGGRQILSVDCPASMAGLPLPPLQIELKDAPTDARIEMSAGPGLPFVPVYLKNGSGRLPVGVADTKALANLRVRITQTGASSYVVLTPVRSLTASLRPGSGQFLDVITNWGPSGDLFIQSVDAAGRTVPLTNAQGTPLEPDGAGWAWVGSVASATQTVVETGFTETTVFPVTLKIRSGSDEYLSQTLYAPEAGPVLCGNPGKDGAGGTLTGVINTYYPLNASVSAGAISIPVGSSAGTSTPISTGDLLLVMQMQAAQIDSDDSSSYGDGSTGSGYTSLNGAGSYEYVVAQGPVSSGSVPILGAGPGGGTLNGYSVGPSTATQGQQTAQVIRVPQYSTATLSSSLTCLPWNGSVGGVLAMDVAGTLTLGGTVSVDGMGFRGGAQQNLLGETGVTNTEYRIFAPANATTTTGTGGMKGEGIAGTPRLLPGSNFGAGLDGYPYGDFYRGAPGNAGGGGNDGTPSSNSQNSGGGGGANGGAGGNGGNTWNSNLAIGGLPGSPVTGAPSLIILGGGGGAGVRNNISAGGDGSGAAGGGIVLIRASGVTGSGTISANGANAPTSQMDGAGGGGAGGAILVYSATGGLSSLTVTANGGDGGNAWPNDNGGAADRHGPGGGGGGGAILLSGTPASALANGGANGITTTLNDPYGAAPGASGTIAASLSATQIPGAGSQCQTPPTPGSAIMKTTSVGTGTVTPGQTLTYYVTVTNNTSAPWTNVSVTDTPDSNTTYVPNSTQITSPVPGFYADSFPSIAYTGSTGTLPWSSPWQEFYDDNSATSGYIKATSDSASGHTLPYSLSLYNTNRNGSFIVRPLDLTADSSATLSFTYRRVGMNSNESVDVGISTNFDPNNIGNSTYSALYTISGNSGNNDTSYVVESGLDLSAYAGQSVYLVIVPTYLWKHTLYLDDFQIQVSQQVPATTGGSAPPNLTQGLSIDLQPGDSMTISYQTTVNSTIPAGVTSITNTATVSATGLVTNQSASVTNPLLLPPVVSSPIDSTDTSVGGNSSVIGGTVSVYQNGTLLGTAIVASDGTWSYPLAPGQSLVPGATITATVTANGQTSSVSNSVIVQLPAPVVSSPINSTDTAIGGTSAVIGGTISVYQNGTLLGTTTVVPGGTWAYPLASGQSLTPGAAITATVASGGFTSPLSPPVTVQAPALLRATVDPLGTPPASLFPGYPGDPSLDTTTPEQTNFLPGGTFPHQASDLTSTPALVFYQLTSTTQNLRVTKGTDSNGQPIVVITY